MKNNRGYSVAVLCILMLAIGICVGIISVTYSNFDLSVQNSSRTNTALSIQTAIHLFRVQYIIHNGKPGKYPTVLDTLNPRTPCSQKNPCFTQIFPNGIAERQWYKMSAYKYQFITASNVYEYEYNPRFGTFIAK